MVGFSVEQVIQVGAQGAILREIMEYLQIRWKPTNGDGHTNGSKIRIAVLAVSAIAVKLLGFHPTEVLQLAVDSAVKFPLDAVLLAGSAMGTHDVLDWFKNARKG